jgi:hypothetical protein
LCETLHLTLMPLGAAPEAKNVSSAEEAIRIVIGRNDKMAWLMGHFENLRLKILKPSSTGQVNMSPSIKTPKTT